MENFKLGAPALVCRWRLANGELPLENRHMRALAARKINGDVAPVSLVAWVKQRIEWGLAETPDQHENGVLMLVVDESGQSALSIGPYLPLQNTSARDLLGRAEGAREEALTTGVAPEELWIARDNTLIWCSSPEFSPAGASSLVADLGRTMGLTICRDPDMLDEVARYGYAGGEAFLVSDEHGVVPSDDHGGQRAEKFAQSYSKLLSRSLHRL